MSGPDTPGIRQWNTSETLHVNDVFWHISKEHTQDDFSRLPLIQMAQLFDTNGTASIALLNTVLFTAYRDHLEDADDTERALFDNFKLRLNARGEAIKTCGFEGKKAFFLPVNSDILCYVAGPFPGLADFMKGKNDEMRRKWANHLCKALLVELWALIGKNKLDRGFIRKMFGGLYASGARQFGYTPGGSVVNNVIVQVVSTNVEDAAIAERSLAFLQLLRIICHTISDHESFWPYTVDDKSFSNALNPKDPSGIG
ncbi:hypothetical protein COY07_03570 [Candidatus Peregrinibacteria bacterium CG_4_10_14_0_2_um_filter_43_11]|nr:MAG: hypothetical protein COY07_03570 [Candidatus Peregrinibacteria bacterium CG_4_10_14_0_2_um_filter_43_11]